MAEDGNLPPQKVTRKRITRGRQAEGKILEYLMLGGHAPRARLLKVCKKLGLRTRTVDRVLANLILEGSVTSLDRGRYLVKGYEKGVPMPGTLTTIKQKAFEFYVSNGWKVVYVAGEKIVMEKVWSPVGKFRSVS